MPYHIPSASEEGASQENSILHGFNGLIREPHLVETIHLDEFERVVDTVAPRPREAVITTYDSSGAIVDVRREGRFSTSSAARRGSVITISYDANGNIIEPTAVVPPPRVPRFSL